MRKITYNQTFETLMKEYGVSLDMKVDIKKLPQDVQKILRSRIVDDGRGIYFKKQGPLREENYNEEGYNYEEDLANHFHVDWYAKPRDNKHCFILGVQTILLLCEKIERKKYTRVRVSYSFHSAEMSEAWAKYHKLYEEGDDFYIGDRLSFCKMRNESNPIMKAEENTPFWALLTIDIL